MTKMGTQARAYFAVVSVVGIGLLAGFASQSTAIEIPGPYANAYVYGNVRPRVLPRNEPAPVGLTVHGYISTVDGRQPPAIREVKARFDRNGAINAKGLPTCTFYRLKGHSPRSVRRNCGQAIVGMGAAQIEVSPGTRLPATLTVFNGGVTRDGTTTVFIYSALESGVAMPSPVIVVVKVKAIHDGRFGLGSVWKIPPILQGSASVIDFSLHIKRLFDYNGKRQSYLTARCQGGLLFAQSVVAFRDDAHSGTGEEPSYAKEARVCTRQSSPH